MTAAKSRGSLDQICRKLLRRLFPSRAELAFEALAILRIKLVRLRKQHPCSPFQLKRLRRPRRHCLHVRLTLTASESVARFSARWHGQLRSSTACGNASSARQLDSGSGAEITCPSSVARPVANHDCLTYLTLGEHCDGLLLLLGCTRRWGQGVGWTRRLASKGASVYYVQSSGLWLGPACPGALVRGRGVRTAIAAPLPRGQPDSCPHNHSAIFVAPSFRGVSCMRAEPSALCDRRPRLAVDVVSQASLQPCLARKG